MIRSYTEFELSLTSEQRADALIVVWDGKSPGTKNMIDHMRRMKKPVYIRMFARENE